MKTDNDNASNDAIFASMASELQAMTLTIPNAQVVAELQTIVERITFSGLDGQDYEKAKLLVYELFQDELSPPMLAFVHEVASQHGLALLGGRLGRGLLAFCIGHFRSDAEIIFISAVPLNGPFKVKVREQLKQVHPTATKLVFQVVPTIAAGFVIKVGGKIHDMSLRKAGPALVKRYVSSMFVADINRRAS